MQEQGLKFIRSTDGSFSIEPFGGYSIDDYIIIDQKQIADLIAAIVNDKIDDNIVNGSIDGD